MFLLSHPPLLQVSKRRLEWHEWQAAMDGYAVGVAVAGVMAYHVALEHKAVVQEVATDASAENKTADLGVFYDECARCACAFNCSPCVFHRRVSGNIGSRCR